MTVNWIFTGPEAVTSSVWINLMTLSGAPSCGYSGYEQAQVQGGTVAILQTQSETNTSGTYTWGIANHAYQHVQ